MHNQNYKAMPHRDFKILMVNIIKKTKLIRTFAIIENQFKLTIRVFLD